MHDLIKRSPVEPLERPKRTVCRVAERDQICKEVVVREGEDLPSELLSCTEEWQVPIPRSAAASIISIVAWPRSYCSRPAQRSSGGFGATIAIAAAAPPTCQAPCQTPVRSRSWSRSVTSTKSHGCQFFADGASRPASSTFAKSSSLTGAEENSRTLRRDLNASHVSTPITLRPTRRRCPETDRARTLASSPFRSSHHQPRNRLAGLETELGRDDLRPQTRIRQHALDVRARMAVTPVRTDGVPRFVPGAA